MTTINVSKKTSRVDRVSDRSQKSDFYLKPYTELHQTKILQNRLFPTVIKRNSEPHTIETVTFGTEIISTEKKRNVNPLKPCENPRFLGGYKFLLEADGGSFKAPVFRFRLKLGYCSKYRVRCSYYLCVYFCGKEGVFPLDSPKPCK